MGNEAEDITHLKEISEIIKTGNEARQALIRFQNRLIKEYLKYEQGETIRKGYK